ncbi:hypothetical protein ABGV38_00745 [Escherichia coli]
MMTESDKERYEAAYVNAKIIGRKNGDADDFLDSQEIKHVY